VSGIYRDRFSMMLASCEAIVFSFTQYWLTAASFSSPLIIIHLSIGSAYGTRTRAPALRGPCPNRLDERAEWER
jgi:hypothetical protein